MYKRGEIVLIPVPFSDLSSVKRRPVLVISNRAHNSTDSDMIVVAITSNLRQDGIVIETKDFLILRKSVRQAPGFRGLFYILLSITFDISISSRFLLPSNTNKTYTFLLSPLIL